MKKEHYNELNELRNDCQNRLDDLRNSTNNNNNNNYDDEKMNKLLDYLEQLLNEREQDIHENVQVDNTEVVF